MRLMHSGGRSGAGVRWLAGLAGLVVMLGVLAFTLPQAGCASPETERARAVQADSALADTQERIETALRRTDLTDAQRTDLAELLNLLRQDRATIADRLARLDAAASAAASDDPVVRIIGGVAGWLPAPIGGAVTLGLPLLAFGVKLWRTSAAAQSMARSVEALKTADPAVAQAIERYAPIIDQVQTAKARAIVDGVQGGRTPLTERLF